MASTEKRQTERGTRYRVRITLKGHPRISETFTTRREATRWAERTTEAIRQRRFQPEAESEQRTDGAGGLTSTPELIKTGQICP